MADLRFQETELPASLERSPSHRPTKRNRCSTRQNCPANLGRSRMRQGIRGGEELLLAGFLEAIPEGLGV